MDLSKLWHSLWQLVGLGADLSEYTSWLCKARKKTKKTNFFEADCPTLLHTLHLIFDFLMHRNFM
jgi:hypothetical protein